MAAIGFFRRNTKMVVWVMVILMGMFLLGSIGVSQMSRWFRPSGAKAVLGDSQFGELTRGEIEQSGQDIDIISRLGLGSAQRIVLGQAAPGEAGFLRFLAMAGQKELDRNVAWALLVKESESMGFQADEILVDKFVTETLGVDEATWKNLLVKFRGQKITESQVRRALGNFLKISMAFEGESRGSQPSEHTIREMFRDLNSKMDLAMVRLQASDFLEDAPKRPEGEEDGSAELRAMWEKNKDYAPRSASNPNPMGFGYLLPPRVKLEYAFIDWDDLEFTIDPSEDEIYDYWSQNPERFADPTDKAATKPAKRSYVEDKYKARELVTLTRTAEKLKKYAGMLRDHTRNLEQKPAGDRTPLEQAAESMTATVPVRYKRLDAWQTPMDIMSDPLLRDAYSSKQMPLGRMVFQVKELLDEEQASQAVASTGKVFGRPMNVIRMTGGRPDSNRPLRGMLLWRVIEAQKSAPPTVFDAKMREQVLADWRLAKAYEIAMEKASKAKTRVTEVGMTDVAKDLDSEVIDAEGVTRLEMVTNFRPQPGMDQNQMFLLYALTRPFRVQPGVQSVKIGMTPTTARDFLDAVFEMAADDAPALTADKPAPASAVKVVGLPESRSVVLVQRLSYTGASEQELTADDGAARREVVGKMHANNRFDMMAKWYSIDEIKARTGFNFRYAESAEKKPAESEGEADVEQATTQPAAE